jgi:hypothetical protein
MHKYGTTIQILVPTVGDESTNAGFTDFKAASFLLGRAYKRIIFKEIEQQ